MITIPLVSRSRYEKIKILLVEARFEIAHLRKKLAVSDGVIMKMAVVLGKRASQRSADV